MDGSIFLPPDSVTQFVSPGGSTGLTELFSSLLGLALAKTLSLGGFLDITHEENQL
jgi:hypothetical protein